MLNFYGDRVREARGKTTRSMLARLSGYSASYIESVERGDTPGTAESSMAFATVLDAPQLPDYFCRLQCPIGQAFSGEVLNNIDTHPMAIISKLEEEMDEGMAAVQGMKKLLINKNRREDYVPGELIRVKKAFQELLDIELNIEVLKIALASVLDLKEEIHTHRTKCYQKGYIKTKNQGPRRQAIASGSY